MAYHERSKQFDEYQLAVTCVSRILTSAGLAAPWAQMGWGHSVPESAAAYEVDTGLPVHLLTFADLMPGFTMTTSSWGLNLAHNEWRNGIIGKGLVSKTVIRKDRSHGTTAQISRARLSRELRALLSQSGVDYSEDLPQPDMVDHDKVRALLDDWRSNPSMVIDLPPPTGELLEAVGDEPEPWQAALLAGVEDCLPFNPYVHYLCCAVSNCHLKEIRPQDLDWLVEGYKELVLFRESRRENWYNKRIPDYFGPAPTGL
ncbi:hypothetical protein GGTG_02174 [Gaeumannomyces tritici R3-111a-1]|uniref:Uncharacterized protein n=1 Tax=Gaeumannomyces tritici (strain R3-111a-1) TaxID=644352 RepID=J3NLM5_GAET3|nr:hypothetical protein GGTG_02174 [Gaeumannomyces tritici R3-111a-1]EJT82200.1 hypothetical protein GGTG_02174 [Gaeumannomyces tritici R3-111a-1]